MIPTNYKQMWKRLNDQNERFEHIINKLKGGESLSTKNVVSIEDLTEEDIGLIFRITLPFKEEFINRPTKKIPLLKGKSILLFFAETSTRTRISFELGGKQLGADTINLSGSASSMAKKGETLNDTARTLNAMHADCIILRHSSSGTPQMIAKEIDAPVINAGDGWHEHPTQALLDMYTIYESKGKIKGLNIVIVGDIIHSRVAGSLIRGLVKMGAKVKLAGPPTLMPMHVEKFGVEVFDNFDVAIKDADVIYALRVQRERAAMGDIPTLREYSKMFCVNARRLKLAHPDAIVMHPGPINREIDITSEVMECDQSRVEDQVTNGLALRMALIFLLIKGKPNRQRERQRKLLGDTK